jgi:hypothetical protein
MTKFILIYVVADDCGIQKVKTLGIFDTKLEANQNATQSMTKVIEDNDLDPNEIACGKYSIYDDNTGDHHKWAIREVTI